MTQIKIRRDERIDLAVIEITGDIVPAELLRFLESNFGDYIDADSRDFASRAIIDFRAANLSALTKDFIKTNIEAVKKFIRPDVKAALIFSNPGDASVGEVISKAIHRIGLGAEIRRFYNLYRAKDWLLY
jgi:hypothetical protein